MGNSVENFYDLETWKRAHKFALIIYKISKDFPKSEMKMTFMKY